MPTPSNATTSPTPPATNPHRFLPDGTDLGPLSSQRTLRFQDLLPLKLFTTTPVTIVGCGAIGRQVALTLAHMGVLTLTLIDPDTITGLNLGTQGWLPHQLGKKKVDALATDLRDIHSGITAGHSILPRDARFRPDHLKEGHTVFCCVDDMDVRHAAFEAWKIVVGEAAAPRYPFFDARMGAEACHLFSAYDLKSVIVYDKSLFPQREAESLSCTACSTFYCAAIAANLLVSQYTKLLRKIPTDPHLTLNLLSMDLFVPPPVR